MKILDHNQISQKIKRIAYQILEANYDKEEIILAGINNKGLGFAKMLKKQIEKISEMKITLKNLRLNPAAPLDHPVKINADHDSLKGKVVIVVDDVANTGRTMFYAMKVFMDVIPEKIETVVLIDRKHKAFPVEMNHFGLSLATTVQNNIQVDLSDPKDMFVIIN